MKNVMLAMVVLGVGMVLGSPALSGQGAVRPPWINLLPREPGKLYALGAAPLGDNPALALKQASQNARLELATQIRASVKGETSVNSQMTSQRSAGQAASGSARQQVSQDSRITTQLMELTGLEIAENWTDPASRTLYALACLDVGTALGNLRNSAQALEPGLKGVGANIKGPREAAKALFRLRAARDEAARLAVLAGPLVEFSGDASFRPMLQDLQADLERRLDWVRGFLTLGVETPAVWPADLLGVLRLSAQEQGFGWAEGSPELLVRVQLAGPLGKARPWWTVDGSDFITVKAPLQLSLCDGSGNALGSGGFEASGVGTIEVKASQAMLKDLRKKLDGLLDQWLADLAL